MEPKKIHRIVIKWFVLITLFSLSLFVEKLYAFRVFVYNTHSYPVRLKVFNGQHCQCLTKVLAPQSPSFIDVGPVLTICNEPINKIDIYTVPQAGRRGSQKNTSSKKQGCYDKKNNLATNKEVYIGTIQGKNILYNPDILV